ncbi:MAG TPA: hypothetical protein VGH32_07190 [Pirellulales bacterium]
MQDVDFLPAAYRQQTVHRKANVWRLAVGGGFAAALLASFAFQQFIYSQTAKRLDELKPQLTQAKSLAERLGARQTELKAANRQADLCTFLRHPWPRSQLVAAALRPLPVCVTLQDIHIGRVQSQPGAIAGSHAASRDLDADLKKLAPTERDLLRLGDEEKTRPNMLTLSGVTTDTAALQHYLVALGKESLFIKAELTSLEANHNEQPGTWRFAARLEIRSGYGQVGGPEAL